jgi:hypothetical protein
MDLTQLLRAITETYQQNIGQPFANIAGPFGRGLLGLERPEYGEEQAYRTGQAVGNMPGLNAPAGLLKAAMQAPELVKAAQALPELAGLLGVLAKKNESSKIISWYPSKKENLNQYDIISPIKNREEFNSKMPDELIKSMGYFFGDVAGDFRILPKSDGGFFSTYNPSWGSNLKAFSAIGDDALQLMDYMKNRAVQQATRRTNAEKKAFEKTLPGRLQKEMGDEFTAFNSARSESQYLIHEPTGQKIRISGHNLPSHYDPSDLDLPNWISQDKQVEFIKKYLEASRTNNDDVIHQLKEQINEIKK